MKAPAFTKLRELVVNYDDHSTIIGRKLFIDIKSAKLIYMYGMKYAVRIKVTITSLLNHIH